MTVVATVKVYDGIVLAADSATLITLKTTPAVPPGTPGSPAPPVPSQMMVHEVFNNSDKICHLHRDLPIGLATWGGGTIDSASISALAKDLRRRFMGRDAAHKDWELTADTYTMAEVADRVVELMYGELFSNVPAVDAQNTGFFLAGYSSGERHPEGWEIQMADPAVTPIPRQVWSTNDSGWRAYGLPDTIGRVFNGYAPSLMNAIRPLVPPADHPAMDAAFQAEGTAAALAVMPFGDAIALARFCVELTIGYTRFQPGPDLVGGPIDVAGISRHEGFKWVQRKHYYPPELNPRRPHDHDR